MVRIYDALWVTTLAKIESNNTQNIQDLKNTFIDMTKKYKGITGLINFNDAGDRFGSIYESWKIEENIDDNQLEWSKVT